MKVMILKLNKMMVVKKKISNRKVKNAKFLILMMKLVKEKVKMLKLFMK